jgi:hypothetical protein
MAYQQRETLTTDNNLGTVAITLLPGAMQVDVVMRMSRADFLRGRPPIKCLDLEDRYIISVSQAVGQTVQQALGYEAANFISIDDVLMI